MTTATATQSKVIASRVIDPSEPGIFVKRKKSDPARHLVVSCSCDSCPLLAAKQCVMLRFLSANCPYGRFRDESGPTRRANKFWDWIKERKAAHGGIGWNLSAPTDKLAFIGDYVFLPYSHMTMRKDVPFLKHTAFIVSGVDFMPRENWTLETVLKLIDFRPEAMFGGEIASYQKDVVPKFIAHIRELDADMWAKLIAVRPQYDTAPNYVGRTALLWTLAAPISLPPYHKEYRVPWLWNGKTLSTTAINAYNETWGHVRAKSATVEIVPAADAKVVVSDNAWVTNDTVFVD